MANRIFNILNVSDLDKSFAFYKGLGLKTTEESMPMSPEFSMRFATVSAGKEHSMMLFARDFPGADPADVAWASGDVGKGILVNVGVPNAAKTHAAAKASGAKPGGLQPNPWGGQAFTVADPDGYFLMITDKFPAPAPKRAKKSAARKAAKKPAKKGAKKAAKKAGKRR